jgi:hypothetical protein
MRNPGANRTDLSNLNLAIDEIITGVMAFYRKNRKTDSGVLDTSSFFKRSKLDCDFKDFWSSAENSKRVERCDHLLKKFLAVVNSQI